MPEILSPKEVIGLIHACKDTRQRALLMLTYGSGLRVSEVVRLKPSHLETDRMMVRVEQAKGRKDRYTLLSQKALEELRVYWRYYKPEHWLFYSRDKKQHISTATAQKIYYRAKETAKISRGKGIHTLRHCFATHLLEKGIDIYLIKKFLGHKSIETTMIYLHVVPSRMKDVQSPLDDLLAEKGTMP